ncbi:ring-opening amidohydrolase [Paenibacillus sp. 19GGS1-52]|uniref:cyanuric acid amidohydrolase n=1 Tax=Paenibacillus sp. 19GGS1-52 TaxID=2758563 RepID=UPI001EFB4BDF|nr:ring-opening amidohydrolase [Paenibacillus sp. 19GGS1-52]ULO08178.1 ring-opening amidohydrolase [Paenibacillus sp. 19GGS1-52]
MKCSVTRVPINSPSDVLTLKEYVDQAVIHPGEVIAVLGKTEGNGCVNDFTRGYAVRSVQDFFAGYIGEKAKHISYVMSGGTEGILSPHLAVVSRNPVSEHLKYDRKSLAIGVAKTPEFLPEEIGRLTQVEQVAAAVKRAIYEAGITDNADVHFVQVKCPLLTTEHLRDASSRSVTVVTEDTYKSMGYSRGASALGVAIALEEIAAADLKEADICQDWEQYSFVASTSAGSELNYCEVIVFGNSDCAEGPFYIDHDVMKDSIDADVLRKLLAKHEEDEWVQVLAKAEADPTGYVRNRRHTMLNDSDINHTRHARAVVGGVLASVCGDPMIYVSGGAEHQGPAGGGPVAVIFKRGMKS